MVHARVGMDEIAPAGPTDVWEVSPGSVNHWTLEPETLGLTGGTPEDLAGGTPAENAQTVRDILGGRETGARRTAVVLNAAAALVVAGIAKDWPDGVKRALESINDGAATGVLEKLIAMSHVP